MSAAGGKFVHFGCPRCTAALKALAKHAGRKQRCPLCYIALTVPSESRPVRESYELLSPGHEAAPAAAEVAAFCPVCHTRITAPVEQVGQTVACPDCGTPTRIPPPTAPAPQRRDAPLESYAMCVDFDPATPHVEPKSLVRVQCSLCNTLMYATLDQVGSQVTCPDCGTKSRVLPPPPEVAEDRFRVRPDDVYAVHDTAGPLPAGSAAHRRHVGFKCRRCGNLMHGTLDEVGKTLTCHDCGTKNVVPPPVERPKLKFENAGEYVAGPGGTTPEFKPIFVIGPRRLGRRGDAIEVEDYFAPRPRPPRRPMFSGVFTFPWRRSVVVRWLALSVLLAIMGFLVLLAASMAQRLSVGAGYFASGEAIFTVLATVLAALAAAGGAALAAITFLAILWDTASGNDDVSEWPEPGNFFDWIGNTMFVAIAVIYGVAPGGFVAWLMGLSGLEMFGPASLSLIVLLPFVLMSSLEQGSPVVPFSPAVARSLWRRPLPWLLFYVESSVVLAAAIGLSIGAMLAAGPSLAIPVGALAGTAAGIIYFRLLGRLAWCCAR